MKVLDRVGRIAVARPNWSNGVRVDYEFKTSIFQSRNNTEKREAMRLHPRMSIQYLAAMRAAGAQRFMRDIAVDPVGIYYVPARWRSTFTTFSGTLGDDFISVPDPAPFWLVPGAQIIITDETLEEAHDVISVTGGVIGIAGTLSQNWPAGVRVMQAFKARLPQSSQIGHDLVNFGQANVRYDVDPGSNAEALPTITPATFEGRELFLTKPNWSEAPKIDYDALRDVVDAGRGVIDVSTPSLDVARVVQAGWTGMDKDQVEELIAFFIRMKGQRTGFYMPSWTEDITVTATAVSSSSVLDVEGSEFHDGYSGSSVYNVLIAFFADGSYQVNRIASTALVGSDTQLTMTSPWAQDVDTTTKVMFCHHMRHASDVLSVQWTTSTVAEIQFTMRSVQAGEND